MQLEGRTFLFRGPDVKRLVEIAEDADERSPTFGQAVDIEEGALELDDLDPALHVVKDQGLYLMPNAAEAVGDDYVVYARGTDRSTYFGGDDFVEEIPTTSDVLQIVGEAHDLALRFEGSHFSLAAVRRTTRA